MIAVETHALTSGHGQASSFLGGLIVLWLWEPFLEAEPWVCLLKLPIYLASHFITRHKISLSP